MRKTLQKIFVPVILAGIFFSCQEQKLEKMKIITGETDLPTETGKNVEFIFSDSAYVKFKLNAAETERYVTEAEAYVVFPKGMMLKSYDKSGVEESSLTSNYAIKHEGKNGKSVFEAKDKVVIINAKGEKLETEHITWDEGSDKVKSDAFVKITTGDEIIMGDGMEADRDFTRYKILNITGTIQLNEEDK